MYEYKMDLNPSKTLVELLSKNPVFTYKLLLKQAITNYKSLNEEHS